MSEQDQNKDKTIIIPPGYQFAANDILADMAEQGEGLRIVFLESVDGEALDEENYTDNVAEDIDFGLPKDLRTPKKP